MLNFTTILKMNSKGPEVKELQNALLQSGLYSGPVDGEFGSLTEKAVKDFQAAQGLKVDGKVGPKCVQALNGILNSKETSRESAPGVSSLLLSRCLKLTASIETGESAPNCYARVSGNFDGQAVSFGALQWNFGQKTLTELFKLVYKEYPDQMSYVLKEDNSFFLELLSGPHLTLMNFFIDIQKTTNKSKWNKWKSYFTQLGLMPECAVIQEKFAEAYFAKALKYCQKYGLSSERAVALMFDICVQNGSISKKVQTLIFSLFTPIQTEEEKLQIIAKCRAEAALPEWIHDVKARKMTIATGRGIIHGKRYDLKTQFQIDLTSATELEAKYSKSA